MTAKLRGSGGVRAVIAENLLLKQQLIVQRRARRRVPNLTPRVLVVMVMDQFTRRLVGVDVHRGPVDAADLCRMIMTRSSFSTA